MNFLKNKLQIIVTVIFVAFVIWWVTFQSVLSAQGTSIQWFGGTYGILALFGAIVGFIAAQKFGGFKTVLGKALSFMALALLLQEAGQLITTYYIYGANVQIPYPSWGDAAYFSSTLSYIVGGFYLLKAVNVRIALKSSKLKFIPFVVPLVMLVISFFVFLYGQTVDFSQPLAVFLNFGYPIGDAVYISLAIIALILSSKVLGGVMRSALIILMIGLVVQYAADFSFLFASNRGTYLAGSYVDLLYLIAYFVTTTSMIKFLDTYSGLKKKTATSGEKNG